MAVPAVHKAGKLAFLSSREWLDLFRAQAAIFGAARTLRKVRIGDLVAHHRAESSSAMSTGAPAVTAAGDSEGKRVALAPRAVELAIALTRAADNGLMRPKCLVRSLALQRMLERSGIGGSVIRVGVKRSNGELLAHAWVELHGAVLGDHEKHTSSFAVLKELKVLGGA